MSISEQLRNALESCKVSRYKIAKDSGVDHAVLRRFLKRERDIKLETASKLAEFLGLELKKRP